MSCHVMSCHVMSCHVMSCFEAGITLTSVLAKRDPWRCDNTMGQHLSVDVQRKMSKLSLDSHGCASCTDLDALPQDEIEQGFMSPSPAASDASSTSQRDGSFDGDHRKLVGPRRR